MDVFFYEAFEEEMQAIQSFMPSHIRAGYTPLTIQEYEATMPPASIISLRTQSVIPANWHTKLDAILSRSAGYDHLTTFAQTTGFPSQQLGYLPCYCVRAVAEQALLLALALLRKLRLQQHSFESFHRDGLSGMECRGKQVLVVGVGRIGYEIASIFSALGASVRGVDLDEKYSDVAYCDIASGLAEADLVFCAMNLNESNRAYFDHTRYEQMKPGALLINIARGECTPALAAAQALNTGQLAGLALDVYNHESELAVSLRQGTMSSDPEVQTLLELSQRPNVITTPHNAFNTQEAVLRKAEQSVRQTHEFLKNRQFIWSIPHSF